MHLAPEEQFAGIVTSVHAKLTVIVYPFGGFVAALGVANSAMSLDTSIVVGSSPEILQYAAKTWNARDH